MYLLISFFWALNKRLYFLQKYLRKRICRVVRFGWVSLFYWSDEIWKIHMHLKLLWYIQRKDRYPLQIPTHSHRIEEIYRISLGMMNFAESQTIKHLFFSQFVRLVVLEFYIFVIMYLMLQNCALLFCILYQFCIVYLLYSLNCEIKNLAYD